MTTMDTQRFAVGFTPLPTAARVTKQRSTLRWRWVTTVISLAILGAFLYFFPPDWSSWLIWVIIALWVASSVFWLVVSLVGLSRAKRDLGRIQPGVSFHIDPEGIEFVAPTAGRVRWEDMDDIRIIGGRGGSGPRLAATVRGERVADVALSVLDASPSMIDSMVRAHSLGRHSLDAARLEALI